MARGGCSSPRFVGDTRSVLAAHPPQAGAGARPSCWSTRLPQHVVGCRGRREPLAPWSSRRDRTGQRFRSCGAHGFARLFRRRLRRATFAVMGIAPVIVSTPARPGHRAQPVGPADSLAAAARRQASRCPLSIDILQRGLREACMGLCRFFPSSSRCGLRRLVGWTLRPCM